MTTFSYDLNGKVVRTVDPLSRAIVQSYDGNGNLLSDSDAKGQLTYYAYDPANQRTKMVDRAGKRLALHLHPRGQLRDHR